jgi:hypothetical protein
VLEADIRQLLASQDVQDVVEAIRESLLFVDVGAKLTINSDPASDVTLVSLPPEPY